LYVIYEVIEKGRILLTSIDCLFSWFPTTQNSKPEKNVMR
jgi:hypothetical protein